MANVGKYGFDGIEREDIGMSQLLRIGELARRTDCRAETIRYYERERLLPRPARTAGNYRLYGQGHVDRLSFIRHCRALDMSLREIRALLRFYDAPQIKCGGANEVLDMHIADIARRIGQLKGLQRQLKSLRGLCTTERSAGNCGMLHELSAGARPGPRPRAG